MIVVFFSWPGLTNGWHDFWPLTVFYVVLMVFIECLIICRKHFWIWSVIATYGMTFACFQSLEVHQHSRSLIGLTLKKEIIELSINVLLHYIFVLPIAVLVYNSRKKTARISAYLLLWPMGWLAGILFAESYYKMDVLNREVTMNVMFYLGLISIILFFITVNFADKTKDMKKHAVLMWIGIISWLPTGVIPGAMGLGWKYSLFATLLPIAAIYRFFILSRQAAKDCMKTR